MKCLRTVIWEHASAFKIPRGLPHTLKFEELHVRIVAKRAQYKDDPCDVMRWIQGCHRMYRLLDRKALCRLGKTRCCAQWDRPDETYRQALNTLIRDEARMKACVKKYFKIRYNTWNWFFTWIRSEGRRLARRRANKAEPMKLAA